MDTVYVVDADKAIRDALKTLLESFEIPVESYSDSGTFFQAVQGSKRGFVLVEAEMPGLNGLGLLRALRSVGNTMPVVLVTASASPDFLERARCAGVAAVIQKPFLSEDAWVQLPGGRR